MPTSTPWLQPDSPTRYGSVSRCFHWGMALGFACMFAAALTRFFAKDSALYELLWPIHRPLGTLMLLLVVLRAAWSLLHARQRPAHTHQAARLGHLALYALMAAVPLVALLRQYGSGRGFAPWGIPLMDARTDDKIEWMTELGSLLHGPLGWVLLACVVGHVGMALWHRRPGHTDVLPRMLGQAEPR
ncbi:cytochrome b561 [Rhodoferax ferrireducens]|uniref:Cytochrome b561 n=1 Tax=Rhodoferax ferrireducens TaxID=192843 RepID=A0ABU2C7D0_9BURK|nr:cytochrome b [Rhodoferax ferrireducens]MDR7377179.1 cytochrome b561 [Rhodoferax ferrireducens]